MSDFPQDKGRDFCIQHVYANQTVLVSDLSALEFEMRGDLADEFALSGNCVNYSQPTDFEDWGFAECVEWLKGNNVPESEWPDEWAEWNNLVEWVQLNRVVTNDRE